MDMKSMIAKQQKYIEDNDITSNNEKNDFDMMFNEEGNGEEDGWLVEAGEDEIIDPEIIDSVIPGTDLEDIGGPVSKPSKQSTVVKQARAAGLKNVGGNSKSSGGAIGKRR